MLGVTWKNRRNKFTFKVKPWLIQSQVSMILSERKILSQVARIYDPIGLQEQWKKGTDWDEELPPEIKEKWTGLFEEMMKLKQCHKFRKMSETTQCSGLSCSLGLFRCLPGMHLVPARMHDGSLLMESTCHLLQRDQEWHPSEDSPSLV